MPNRHFESLMINNIPTAPLKSLLFTFVEEKIQFLKTYIRVSLHPGFGLPRVAATEVRQRVQDAPAGPPADPGDGRRQRAQGADGRAHAGDGGLAAEHVHAARAQLARQQHRGHPPQEAEGGDGRTHTLIHSVGVCAFICVYR